MQRVSPFIDSETGKPVSLKRTKSTFKPPRKLAKIEEAEEEEVEQTQPLDFDVAMDSGSSESEGEFDDAVLREEIQSWLALNGPAFYQVESQKHFAKMEKAKKKSTK